MLMDFQPNIDVYKEKKTDYYKSPNTKKNVPTEKKTNCEQKTATKNRLHNGFLTNQGQSDTH